MDGPRPQRVVHNMDSTEIPVYGEQEHSACDGHFESLLSPAGETCALLLVIAGGRTPEPAAIRGDAGLARAVAGSDGIERRDPVRSAAELSPSSWGQEAKVVANGAISVSAGVPLPRPRIQVVHGTVLQKCARNTLPARSGILYRPAIEGRRCHPLPTSSTRAPEVTPN